MNNQQFPSIQKSINQGPNGGCDRELLYDYITEIEVKGFKEEEDYSKITVGNYIKYLTIRDDITYFRSGGIINWVEKDYFRYKSGTQSFSVQRDQLVMFWIKISKNNIKPTDITTFIINKNFNESRYLVEIDDKIIYRGRDQFGVDRFKKTAKYLKALKTKQFTVS